jgi:hypothetical protein
MRGVIKLYWGPRTYPFFFIKKVCGPTNDTRERTDLLVLIPFYTHAIFLVTRSGLKPQKGDKIHRLGGSKVCDSLIYRLTLSF